MPPRERADAARNRHAILRATEALLAEHGPEHVSLDEIAARAGVGKGTLFRRFGSRAGLLRALVEERSQDLMAAVESGPPPLGPGAPPAQRLSAFFDEILDVATRDLALMAAYDHALTTGEPAAGRRQDSPIYLAWHAHVAALIGEARPDLDADLLGHILFGALHSDLVMHLVRRGESARLAKTLRQMVDTLLS